MINVLRPLRSLNQVGLAELILTGGWYIWWERRKYVHGETVQNPTRAAMSIATLTTNYQRAMKKKTRKPEGWKKPSEGKLLLNVDASYKSDRGTGSTGAIIRDSSGSFIAAGSHGACGECIDGGGDCSQGGLAAGTAYWLQSAHDPIGLLGGSRNNEARWIFSYGKCPSL